ncbi:MAG: PhzF family phenazine biosynthesis protein [Acidobacteria bacterium]|nr:PhzF family phenazine biosynthesis protein [Acidobacteriota bacterium]
MRIPLFQVDAFTRRRFGGNPAAICPLPKWLPDETLQTIAAENNLAETAYFVAEPDGYRLRWFTPEVEVDLCGHATLAAAFVLMDCLGFGGDQVTFHSRSGPLTVARAGELYTLDFPSLPGQPQPPSDAIAAALGAAPSETFAARDTMCVYESAAQVQALKPNMQALKAFETFAFIATAPGEDCDFVSRFFAPSQGIDEDPVTGSAHCTLTPYWAKRLNKSSLFARQISARGGELWCEDCGDRVRISGHGALYLTGFLEVD